MSVIRKFSVVLVFLPVLTACYVPVPAEITSIGRGEHLRVVVSPSGGNENSSQPLIGFTELWGEFQGLSTDSLTIAAELNGRSDISKTLDDVRQHITLPRSNILQVTVPRLHRARTFAVVGSALALAVLVFTDVFDVRGDGGSRPPQSPPDVSPFRGPW